MRILFIFLAVMGLSWPGNSYSLDSLKEYGLGFQWNPKQRQLVVPFELYANLIVVPLQLNKSDTLRFLVDTGLGTTLLTDSSVYQKLGLKSLRKLSLLGLGNGDPIQADVVIDNQLNLGKAVALHQNIIYVSNDQLNLSEFVGTKIHGVIGYELFSNLVVCIDYARHQLVLTQPNRYRYRKRKGQRFDLEISENKPYLNTMGIQSKQGDMNNRLLLDSGAGHVLFLEGQGIDSSQFSRSNQLVYLGKGLNGSIVGYWGRVPNMRLGSLTWSNVPTAFPQNKSALDLSKGGLQGSLGGEFLRRFTITFHYLDQYVLFKPNGRKWKRSFDFGMSGLNLRAQGPLYRIFVVEAVQPFSPAAVSGVLAGDEIWTINGKRADALTLGEINRILRRKSGDKIELVIRRDKEFHWIQFTLGALF
jgi:hypothetical protein